MFLGCDILSDSTSFNFKEFNSKLSSFSAEILAIYLVLYHRMLGDVQRDV